jgi:hypothetical protein
MQEWVVSATASDGADPATAAADVRQFLESKGAHAVFATVVGACIVRVVFRWPAASRERAESDAARLVQAAFDRRGRSGGRVRAVAR